MKDSHLLKKKIQVLEKKLNEKDKLLNQYLKSLKDSDLRIKKITQSLKENSFLLTKIHKNLLPVRLPQIPGVELSFKFLPAQTGVSGDFFNVIKIKNTRDFGILLSSSQAYSASALFLSSFLKFSAQLKTYKTAHDFLSFVIKKIKPALKPDEKIHLFYGIVSKNSYSMDYCLRGDIFVGHQKKGAGFVALKPSPPFSSLFLKNEKIKSQYLNLSPQDQLVICSPGVQNLKNKNQENFNPKRLLNFLKSVNSTDVLEVRQKLLFACNEFSAGKPLQQDLTVLVIKLMDLILKIHPK